MWGRRRRWNDPSASAAELGAEVLLLEKSVRRGSNTELSGGLVQGAGTRYQAELGIEDSPELMMSDIVRKNKGRCDRAVVRAICERSPDVVHFLADHVGLNITLDTKVHYFEHSAFRLHRTPTETGAEIVAGLRRAIASQPRITFVDDARVAGLITQETDVVGLEVGNPHHERIRAGAVLLACDGFAGNREMLQRHCPEIAQATYIGSENNVGDGILWGAQAGADLRQMTAYQGHSHVNPSFGTRLGGGLPSLGSLIVNLEGRRFEREDQGYSEFARVLLSQPEGVGVEIFDQRIFDIAWHTGAFREAFDIGAIRGAQNARELAGLFRLSPEILEKEIAEYNEAVGTGTDRLCRREFAFTRLYMDLS